MIAVLGRNEFVVGFQLAGIKHIIEVNGFDLMEKIKEIKNKFSIVVVEEELLNRLNNQERMEIEAEVHPVFIPLSTSPTGNLRYLIKKSIGVDLMAQ